MVFEIAMIDVLDGHESAFVDGVRAAKPLFEQARGFRSIALNRSIEHPRRFRVVIGWDTVANHMEDFRNSPAFVRWREFVGGHFASAPAVEHVVDVDLD